MEKLKENEKHLSVVTIQKDTSADKSDYVNKFGTNTVKDKYSTVGYERWVNCDTGEMRDFAVITKDTADHGFHKVWIKDLARILGILGGSKITVFQYILENINPLSNEFGGTMREVAENTKVDLKTVNTTLKLLQEEGFFKRVRNGTYKVNPSIIAQGKHDKRVSLIIKYNNLPE